MQSRLQSDVGWRMRAAGSAASQGHIDIAQAAGGTSTPLQKVKLGTARGHILLSDRDTRSEGLSTLERCRELAVAHQLLHQVSSIDRIMGSIQDPANRRKVS
ncbi:hypothetical protein GCM10010530_54550 [Kribbella aluminosa]